MFEYQQARLETAEDYLQAQGPSPARVLLVGEKEYEIEIAAFEEEQERWLREAPVSELARLTNCALKEAKGKADEFITHKLLEAYEERGTPGIGELEKYATATADAELHQILAEIRAEGE